MYTVQCGPIRITNKMHGEVEAIDVTNIYFILLKRKNAL